MQALSYELRDSDIVCKDSLVPLTSVFAAEIDRIVDGWHHDPHSILGAHVHAVPNTGVKVGLTKKVAAPAHEVQIRVLRPWATSVSLVTASGRIAMNH